MSDLLCWLIGALTAISVYLILSARLMRWLFGIVILSTTINLIIFVSGRLGSNAPAFIPQGKLIADVPLANPLPQALILTAIVIGFGLLAFSLVLVRRVWRVFGTSNSDRINYAEVPRTAVKGEEV